MAIHLSFGRGVTLALLALVAVSCKPKPGAGGDLGTTASPGATDSGKPMPAEADSNAATPPGNADSSKPRAAVDSGRVASLADLRAEVMRLIGDAACSDVSQCRAIAFGTKPCGGPWQYLVYSTATTDSTALAAAVARYNSQEAALNKSEGRVSDCSFVAPATLKRVNGRCVAGP